MTTTEKYLIQDEHLGTRWECDSLPAARVDIAMLRAKFPGDVFALYAIRRIEEGQ